MKKILGCLLVMFMLCGCSSHKNISTFMALSKNDKYAVYNTKGEKLTDFLYTAYTKVDGVGYIVENSKGKLGLISLQGKEIIAFGEYETLEATDQMFYATKAVKTEESNQDEKKEKTFITDNLYVLDSKGKVLYSASKETQIMKSGLPVIHQGETYIVLNHTGDELYKGKKVVKYAYQYDNSFSTVIGFEKSMEFSYNVEKETKSKTIDVTGEYQYLLQNEKGAFLYNKENKTYVYVNFTSGMVDQNEFDISKAYYDESQNIILESQNQSYIYAIGQKPIQLTTYYISSLTYLERSSSVYGPHQIYKDGEKGKKLENCQLYPEMKLMTTDIFPVYIMDKGYEYRDFDNKKVIDDMYILAEPFDDCGTAIVQKNEKGYSLIDQTGKILTNNYYYQIKYIGSSYYAVYNKDGFFGILDKDGKEILPVEYTYLPDSPVVQYSKKNYFIVGKHGRSYVYDIDHKMEEVFSVEGELVYYEEGYFNCGYDYYTINGDLME